MDVTKTLAMIFLVISTANVFALNPIHDASVDFISTFSKNSDRAALVLGEGYASQSNQKIRIPIAYLFPVNHDFQMGIGLQSRWYREPNNIRLLQLGLQYAPTKEWSLQADLLVGVANYAGNGIALRGDYLLMPYSGLHFLGTARIGFLDALVWHPDYSVLSVSLTPQMHFNENFQADLELFTATQAPAVTSLYSIDLGPSFTFCPKRNYWFQVGAIVGLAGPNRTRTKYNLAQKIAF